MSEIRKDRKKKSAAEVIALIAWIIGGVFFGVYAVTNFASAGNPVENPADCIVNGIGNLAWFAAFAFGVIHLIRRKRDKIVFIAAVLYVAACAYAFVSEVASGGRLSAEVVTMHILRIAACLLFARFAWILAAGRPERSFSFWLKFWHLPAVLLLLFGLACNLWTEFVRPDGFLWDGFFVDAATSALVAVPVFLMSLAVKKRAERVA